MKMKSKCAVLIFVLLIIPFFVSGTEKNEIEKIKQSGKLKVLTRNNAHCYYTYRKNPFGFEYDLAKAFSKHLGVELNVVIPTWDGLTAALYSGKGDLVAAGMTISESHFDPLAKSFTGVKGFMQLTQTTAKQMGVENRLDPNQSIMGGVKYLSRLYEKYDEAEKPDRLLITLASYNVGMGHILDA